MTPTITIATDPNAAAGDLLVTVTQPSTTTLYSGSLNDLAAQITTLQGQITTIQAQITSLQSLQTEIEAQFTAQGISLS